MMLKFLQEIFKKITSRSLLNPLLLLVAVAGVAYYIYSVRLNSEIEAKDKMLRDEIAVLQTKINVLETTDQIKKNKQLEDDMKWGGTILT